MKAKISTAYHEVTLVIITYNDPDDQAQTRVTFEGEDHFSRACGYVDWINKGCQSYLLSGGYNEKVS